MMNTPSDKSPPPDEASDEQVAAESSATNGSSKAAPPPSAHTLRRPVLAMFMLLVGLAVGRYACSPGGGGPDVAENAAAATEDAATIWTCSMHPQIRMAEPGQCPICGMDLIPVQDDSDGGLDPSMLRMSENAAALAEIQTQPVERRSVSRQVRMVGRVTIDESLLSYITAWVPSRLDRLFVDYTGVRVSAGDHMVEVYSPNLIATQQELLQAVQSVRLLEGSPVDILRDRQAESVASAMERLRLWGLEPAQIDSIIENGKPLEKVTIYSPASGIVIHKNAVQGDYVETGTRIYTIADLSRVWVQLDAYESDLGWLHYGQRVEFVSEAWPGETFIGRISFIDPVLNDRTRTVKVRLNVDNAEGKLKPDMFVGATVESPMTATGNMIDPELADQWMCPMHPEVIDVDPGSCWICGMDLVPTEELGFGVAPPSELPLVIPVTAPLVTGKRAVVYVRVPDTERPTYEGREIALGPRAGDWYVVPEGLEEGELVVVNGAFKIDSELQIRAKPSMMSPDGGVAPPEHDHGGMSAAGSAADAQPHEVFQDIPEVFRQQLGLLLSAYLETQVALAADDPVAAAVSGAALAEALDAVDMALLTGAAHMAWMKDAAALGEAAHLLNETADIESQRAALRDITTPLLRALQAFGYALDGDPVAVFYCPMAFNEGANWLQVGDVTSNPYYGESMLRCGDLVRVVPVEN